MTQRERQIATLTAAGFTSAEVASQLGISTSTVDRARAVDDVKALIAVKEAAGLTPRDTLDALLYSKDANIRMKAAVELGKMPESDESRLPPPLAEGVKRVTVEDHLGTTTTRVYPAPEWTADDESAAEDAAKWTT
jgi:hypothetical protein